VLSAAPSLEIDGCQVSRLQRRGKKKKIVFVVFVSFVLFVASERGHSLPQN